MSAAVEGKESSCGLELRMDVWSVEVLLSMSIDRAVFNSMIVVEMDFVEVDVLTEALVLERGEIFGFVVHPSGHILTLSCHGDKISREAPCVKESAGQVPEPPRCGGSILLTR